MSRPSPTDAAGFTLLETMVGLLALSLLAMGLSRLVVGHERLMASMEDWLDGDPNWYVARHEDPLNRVLGAPATLSDTAPPASLPDPPPGRVDVTVLSLDHGLQPFVVVGGDLGATFGSRLTSALARAERATGPRRWTLDQPDWWVDTSTVERRRALQGVEREIWLGPRRSAG